jgi:hypothetical protein
MRQQPCQKCVSRRSGPGTSVNLIRPEHCYQASPPWADAKKQGSEAKIG